MSKAWHEQKQYSRLTYRSVIMVCFTLNENYANFASVLTNTPPSSKTLETSLVFTPIKCSIKLHIVFGNLVWNFHIRHILNHQHFSWGNLKNHEYASQHIPCSVRRGSYKIIPYSISQIIAINAHIHIFHIGVYLGIPSRDHYIEFVRIYKAIVILTWHWSTH